MPNDTTPQLPGPGETPPWATRGFADPTPPSLAQLQFLEALHYQGPAPRSMREAGRLIGELVELRQACPRQPRARHANGRKRGAQ